MPAFFPILFVALRKSADICIFKARLIAAAEGDPEISQTAPQLSFVGSPHLLTMELGGNDCHFAEIAKACIYIGQADGKEYPDPGSACA